MTNTAESALHYPLAERLPAPLETLELAPGIRWIRMALPFALDHINLWLLRDSLQTIKVYCVKAGLLWTAA